MAAIPCVLIRGGTSRGAYFHAHDLPSDTAARDDLLRRVMGGPDALQVDGIGGGHPLTSKVASVAVSSEPDVDVDYLFLQVDPQRQTVSDAQNCGNLLAGVGTFALREGLVPPHDGETVVRVRMLNSGARCHLVMQTPGRALREDGGAVLDGVPGSGAPIVCEYQAIAGSTCGALLPTGNAQDEVDGVRLTCIDNGMPLVALRAADFGLSGDETPEQLEADQTLTQRLEALRLRVGPLMQLGDVTTKSVPKLCLFSAPRAGGMVSTRTFIPHTCHRSIGVLGAVSAASACIVAGTAVSDLAQIPTGEIKTVDVEHPSGRLPVRLRVDDDGSISSAGVVRTARMLFRGEVMA